MSRILEAEVEVLGLRSATLHAFTRISRLQHGTSRVYPADRYALDVTRRGLGSTETAEAPSAVLVPPELGPILTVLLTTMAGESIRHR